MKQTFEIYSEGYVITGQNGNATYEGTVVADTFYEACDILAKRKKWGELYKAGNKEQSPSVWGCKLFETCEEARKSFG